MKKYLKVLTIALIIGFNFSVSAQKKQRVDLPEGADSARVTGKISGRQYALYEIRAEKDDEWSVDLKSANEFIGYTVKAPNGDRYDFLETSPVSGVYTIRVELNSNGAKSKKPASFTLDIKFKIEKKEISK